MATFPPRPGKFTVPTPGSDTDCIDDMAHQIDLAIEQLQSWRDELQLLSYQIAQGMVQGELDAGTNRASAEDSLPLQALLTRRSRFIQTLSQMMKQSSSILDNLAKNLR